jgi:hypothetical protein
LKLNEGGSAVLACRLLRSANQISQRPFRAFLQLTAEKQPDQATPPPGREVEVSIESDEGAALGGLGKGQMFVVFDAKRKAYHKINPAALWVHVMDLNGNWQAAPECRRRQMDGLTRLDWANWVG